MVDNNFDYLIDALKSLPGVGKKQAERIAHFLIKKDSHYVEELVNRILNAKQKIKLCKNCNNYCTGELCDICSNSNRDQTKLCIVSSTEDFQKVEDTGSYVGLYYILNGEVDIKSKTYLDQNVVKKLMEQIKQKNFKEVIIATN